jgi:aryl-alcohol dehydrogenase-like predicted oxidoreductase
MQSRRFGHDGLSVPEIGLGCWQLGGGWRDDWNDEIAQQTLETAYRAGVRFIDTADVYGDGASERSIGRFLRAHHDTSLVVATKLGRAGIYPDGYSRESLREATQRSLERLGMDSLDLTQLHCVPTEVLRQGHVFDWLRELQQEGLIKRWGASVESVEEGLICLEQDGLTSLQVIFNIFRQKPLEELLPRASAQSVGIIVRLPLASGLLAGKITRATTFRPDDHRNFNQDGAAFNVGETFAGLGQEHGVQASERVAALVPLV